MSRPLVFLAVLFCIAAALRVANLGNVNSRTPDERVYTYQARTWLESGQRGIRNLVDEYNGDAETRLYPPPTRVGMIRLLGAVIRWTGRNDESAGAWISCAASIASLLVVALIGFRFLPGWAAVAGLLFYTVLPAELAIARRTWTDALVELAGLLLIWIACEVTRGTASGFWYPVFGLIGSIGLLFKESMPVPWGICALWILWQLARRRDWKNAALLIVSSLALAGASLWWLASQVGSLRDYIAIVLAIPRVNAANPYALEYASGPRYLMLLGFWIIAPVTSLLSVAGLIAVWRKRADRTLVWLALFTVSYIGIAMALPHWINLRYVGNAFGTFCLLAGLGCWWLIGTCSEWLETADRRPFAVVAVAIVIGGAAADYLRFQRYFVRDETVDLSIKMLMDERGQ